jgi:hypothetical protein
VLNFAEAKSAKMKIKVTNVLVNDRVNALAFYFDADIPSTVFSIDDIKKSTCDLRNLV